MQILGYGTFYDVPRGLFINYKESVYYMICEFDNIKDDYHDYYLIYAILNTTKEDFYTGKFYRFEYDRIYIANIDVIDIVFDATRRKSIRSKKLESILDGFMKCENL